AVHMAELDPSLDAREQRLQRAAAILAEALVAAVNPDSTGGEPAPRIDAGAPDDLAGAWRITIGPRFGPGDEEPDARIGKLIVTHRERDAAVAIGAAFVASPHGTL